MGSTTTFYPTFLWKGMLVDRIQCWNNKTSRKSKSSTKKVTCEFKEDICFHEKVLEKDKVNSSM